MAINPTSDSPSRSAPSRGGGFSRLGVMRVLEASPLGVAVFSLQSGRILYANPRISRLLGMDRKFLLETNIRQFYAVPDQHERYLAAYKRNGELLETTVEMHRVGAPNFWGQVSWTSTDFNDQEAVILWLRDITASKLNEDTLGQLFDAAPLPTMLCDMRSGEVKRANRRAEELFTKGQDLKSVRVMDIMGPKSYRSLLRMLYDGGGFVDDFEVMLHTAYGEDYCGLISGQIVTIGSDRYVLIGMNDIADRKQAEETLQRFFNAAPLAMLLVRLRDTCVIRVNRRASELFTPGSSEGGGEQTHSLENYIGKQATDDFQAQLKEGGFVDNFESQLTTDYGESFCAILSGQNIEVGDERCVLIGMTDISDRKRTEEELEKARDAAEQATHSKSQFLATMSHEIRTPMNGVMGMLDMLSYTPLMPDQSEMVEVIRDSARTLLAIIDDILDLSKIEAGKMQLERIPLRLRETVEGALDLIASRAREKRLETAWCAEECLPEHVLGDPVRLRQILINLLGNAVKFTEKGHVTVKLTQVSQHGADVRVRFEVTDQGIGLTQEQQQSLFQPFYQADASTTRHFGGTGLGLSICRRLTSMMAGEISVNSVIGQGSTFWFEVPLQVAPEQNALSEYNLSSLSVLVIDDMAEARASISATLRANGAKVIEARDAEQARLILAQGERLDVVLVDDSCQLTEITEDLLRVVSDSRRIVPLSYCLDDQLAWWCASKKLSAPVLKPARANVLLRIVAEAANLLTAEKKEAKSKASPWADYHFTSPDEAYKAHRLILVAEDNPTNRMVVSKQLTRLGYAFDMTDNGEFAWEALQNRKYNLLLTDCSMPVLDGYALTDRIRKAEAGTAQHLPIIALTANALSGDAEKCLAAGMDDYLSKPLSLEKLAASLERFLSTAVEPDPEAKAEPEQQTKSTERPPVDLAVLAEILGENDHAAICEILGFFIESFPEPQEAMHAALKAKDREGVRRAAHAAKGAARNAGAQDLAETLLAIESQACTQVTMAALKKLATETDKRFKRVQEYVESLLNQP